MQLLMLFNPNERLGVNGAKEVKSHPFFQDIDWDKVTPTQVASIPQATDPKSTDCFNSRGAAFMPDLFHDNDRSVDHVTIAVVGALGVGKSTVIQEGSKQFNLSDFTILSAPSGMLGVHTPLPCMSM
jgi:hypothetical protein